jgi:hypothetical protein
MFALVDATNILAPHLAATSRRRLSFSLYQDQDRFARSDTTAQVERDARLATTPLPKTVP